MIKTIPISKVKLGMYVVDIPGHESLAMRQQGFVRSAEVLKLLRKQGVERVAVDLARKISDDKKPSPEKSATKPKAKIKATASNTPKIEFSSEIPKAKKLYKEARQMQQRVFSDVKLGKNLDVKEVEEIANGVVDSVLRNGDALNCLRLIREKDDYLMEHSIGVAILMSVFGRYLKFSGETLHQLCVGSLLHDIGKVLIPNEILNKPGKLTNEEFAIMKGHAVHSRNILASSEGINPICVDLAVMHHEKLDGSGYPDGLKGEQISQFGRMIAICDIYDALTADRVYHKGTAPTNALKRLLSMTPDHLDNELVQHFIKCIGVYPPGTMVELSNEMVAIVIEGNEKLPTKPKVKVIFNPKTRMHTMQAEIDLAASGCNDSILKAIDPRQYNLKTANYI